jgi:hypothetical protein
MKKLEENCICEDVRATRDIPYLEVRKGKHYPVVLNKWAYYVVLPGGFVHAKRAVESGDFEWVVEKDRDWEEWVDKKKTEYWSSFDIVFDPKTERASYYEDGIIRPKDWQLKQMYQWMLQEYADEKNGDWQPDWTSYNLKYYIFYNGIDSRWELTWSEHTFGINIVYFKNKEDVEQCIDDLKELVLDKIKEYGRHN